MSRFSSNLLLGFLALVATSSPVSAQILISEAVAGSIRRFNTTTGAEQPPLVPAGGPLIFPSAMTVGPDGNLYVSSQGVPGNPGVPDAVMRFNPTTGAFLGNFVSLPGNYDPAGLRFGPDGHLYVSRFVGQGAPMGSGSVDRYNGTTGAAMGTVVPNLTNPTALTFSGSNLFIASFGNGVTIFDGTTASKFIPLGTGGLLGPNGLTVGPDGNFYVVDLFGDAVRRYGPGGTFIDNFVNGGPLAGEFPSDLLFDGEGHLLVSTLGSTFAMPTGDLLRFDAMSGAFMDSLASDVYGGSALALTPVPEPSSFILLGGAAAAAVGFYRRRRRCIVSHAGAVETGPGVHG